MPFELDVVGDAEQAMQQAGVADVHPRRLHLPLSDVGEPRRKLAHDERVGERIQVPADGRGGHIDRPGDGGAVPDLSVEVSDHRPEPAHGRGRDADAEVREVALEERGDVVVPPAVGGFEVGRQVRRRQPAAQPEVVEPAAVATLFVRQVAVRLVAAPPVAAETVAVTPGAVQVAEAEACQLHEAHPPGERLGAQPGQVGGGAAEHDEAARPAPLVHQHPQRGKELGQQLGLVDHDGLAPVRQSEHRLGKTGTVAVVLQIEEGRGRGLEHAADQRRLACLPRPGQQRDRSVPHRSEQRPFVGRPRHELHASKLILENRTRNERFSRLLHADSPIASVDAATMCNLPTPNNTNCRA